ncbi:ribonuclease H-like domain-containing protein [Tanacetum coccineum]
MLGEPGSNSVRFSSRDRTEQSNVRIQTLEDMYAPCALEWTGNWTTTSGKGYRVIGLWGKVRGELGEVLERWFGAETVGKGGFDFGGYGLPSSVLAGKSPFCLVYGLEPSLSQLRVFGCLCYATYCLELLQEFGMLGCNPVSIPIEGNHVMSRVSTEKDPILTNIIGFQKLVGKFIYLSHTRPDIAYYVHYEGRVSSYDDGSELCHTQKGYCDSPTTSMDENTHPEGNVESQHDSDESLSIDLYDQTDTDITASDNEICEPRRSKHLQTSLIA